MSTPVPLNLRIPGDLKTRFGAACTARDKDMTEVLRDAMERFIVQTAADPKAGPRYRAGLIAVGLEPPPKAK